MIQETEDKLALLREYLGTSDISLQSQTDADKIKELCVGRLCKDMGIRFKYNFRSPIFEIYSSLAGEAMCEKFDFNCHVAEDKIRFVKYNGVNLIDETNKILNNGNDSKTFIDIFKLASKTRLM